MTPARRRMRVYGMKAESLAKGLAMTPMKSARKGKIRIVKF